MLERWIGDEIMAGVLAYARQHEWLLSPGENAPEFVARHGFAGILGSFRSPADMKPYERLGMPIVNVLTLLEDCRWPSVTVDHAEVGRMAAEHFRERGFANLGYAGSIEGANSRLRFESLCEAARPFARTFAHLAQTDENIPERFEAMVRWIRELPKPAAVLAFDDYGAVSVSRACYWAEVSVPEEVAILGVNDDALRCRMCMPELSSIRIPWQRIGQEASRLLNALIDGERPDGRSVRVAPTGVTIRGSTEISAITDPVVAGAASFIRQNAHRPMSVGDVVEAVLVGRRPLERRFKAVLGCTLLEEIHRVRLQRARSLLEETSLAIEQVAEQSGFGTALQLQRVLRRQLGVPAAEYRRRAKAVVMAVAEG